MNTLKEVPRPDAITHAIEVLRSCFDHPEADEAIAGLSLLLEQAKWAHHTPKLLSDADAAADLAGVARPGAEPVAWHNPVATAVRDSMTGQVQLEYIGHFPADELVRLYAAPQPHHIDLVNVAVAVRDACHRAWVTSAENWRADVDVRQIVRDTAPPQARQPLTDDQWQRIADTLDCFITRDAKNEIEAVLGIVAAQKGQP